MNNWLAISDFELVTWVYALNIKALVLAALVLMATWSMKTASAATRHSIIVAGVLATLALPVSTVLLPTRNVGLIPGLQSVMSRSPGNAQTISPQPGNTKLSGANPLRTREDKLGSSTSSAPFIQTEPTQTDSASFSGLGMVLFVLIGGIAVMLFSMAIGRLYGLATLVRSSRVRSDRINQILSAACERLGVTREIQVLESSGVMVPVVYGAFFPKIILPTIHSDWSDDQMKALLLHEVAHVCRYDVLKQSVAQLARAIYWFNPLYWIMDRMMMAERERACDDLVIQVGINSAAYAEHLMEMTTIIVVNRNPSWVTVAMADGTDFKDRI